MYIVYPTSSSIVVIHCLSLCADLDVVINSYSFVCVCTAHVTIFTGRGIRSVYIVLIGKVQGRGCHVYWALVAVKVELYLFLSEHAQEGEGGAPKGGVAMLLTTPTGLGNGSGC